MICQQRNLEGNEKEIILDIFCWIQMNFNMQKNKFFIQKNKAKKDIEGKTELVSENLQFYTGTVQPKQKKSK